MSDMILIRGDLADIQIADLKDNQGNPTVFGNFDILVWTAKAHPADATPIIVKSSANAGEIDIAVGTDQAVVHILPADWDDVALGANLAFVWDAQITRAGDPTQITTLVGGDGIIRADVSGNTGADLVEGAVRSGPCTAWVTLAQLQGEPTCKRPSGQPFDPLLLTEAIDVASEILYRLTARLFAGECSDVVFPIVRVPPHYNVVVGNQWSPWLPGRDYRNDWDALAKVTLGGYPIRDVTEVKIDGEIVDPTTYMVFQRRYLVRNTDSGEGWPVANDLTGDPDDTTRRTFRVTYSYGQDPPIAGVRACKTYAIELAKAWSGDPCNLPARVQSITQQGVSFALLDPMAFLDKGRTGIYTVDQWIESINPTGHRRRASVINPDFPWPVIRRQTFPTP